MHSILITGAAGFIGFHLAQRLKAEGHAILGIDNFDPYYDPALKQQRASLLKQAGIKVLDMDITHPEFLTLTGEYSLCIHLAAQVGVRNSIDNPHKYTQSNLVGFGNVLEFCRKRPGIRLLYASSSSVYGTGTPPFTETAATDSPTNLYAATKKANELMAYSYHHLYNLPSIGFRFFTVYGPWGRPDMAYYSFAKDIVEGKPITLFGEGKLERDFTYIDDLIEGIVSAIEYESPYDLFNLGNNNKESVNRLVSLLEQGLNKKAVINYASPPKSDMSVTYADLSHAREKLGYQPTTRLEEGVKHFTQWFTHYH